MKAIFVQGEPIVADYTTISAVSVGDVIVVNGAIRIAHKDIAAGGFDALSIGFGIYDGIKDGGAAVSFADGDPVFWSAGSSLFTATSSDTFAGYALGTSGATATTVRFVHVVPGTIYSGNLVASGTLAVAGNATLSGTLASGAHTVTGAISATTTIKSSGPTSGIGYATGAGGAVSQATDRTTGVTLNTISGAITTQATSLAAQTSVAFTVTNSAVAIGDVIILSVRSGPTGTKTIATVTTVAAGSFQINLFNTDASTADTGAAIINFAVIKAVSA